MRFDPRQSSPVGIVLLLVTIGGLLGALGMGRLVAQNDFLKLGVFFAGALGIGLVLFLGRNVWLLIPLCWPLTGKIRVLPIPLNVQEIAILAAFGFYVVLLVFKKPLHRPRTGWLEFWLIINLLWLAIVYIRNPVGVRAFGADLLGGRPYFEVLMASCAFWVVTRTIIPVHHVRRFPILMATGSLLVSVVGTMTTFFPRLTPLIAPFYSGVDVSTYLQSEFRGGISSDGVGRLTSLQAFGLEMSRVLFSLFRPLGLFNPVHIFHFLLFGLSIAAIFLSGFRSGLIYTGMGFVIACYFWGGLQDAVRALFIAVIAILLLVSAQMVGIALPLPAQRALSFLPGEWDKTASNDAEGSTKWRVDMWKTVIENPDKYLKNPILGTGFGFSATELTIQLSGAFGGTGYIGGEMFEAQLMSGAFHNGPLSTIRFVGIIGLIFLYILFICQFAYSCRLVKRTRGTPYFYLAVFLAVPSILNIFSFTVTSGFFDTVLPGTLFTCAMLRCTSESLRVWSEKSSHEGRKELISIRTPNTELNKTSNE